MYFFMSQRNLRSFLFSLTRAFFFASCIPIAILTGHFIAEPDSGETSSQRYTASRYIETCINQSPSLNASFCRRPFEYRPTKNSGKYHFASPVFMHDPDNTNHISKGPLMDIFIAVYPGLDVIEFDNWWYQGQLPTN